MSSTLARARELAELAEALLTANLPAGRKCDVVLDQGRAWTRLEAGGAVLIISPPRRTFTTEALAEVTWEAVLASGPHRDRVEAWDRLGDLTEALAGVGWDAETPADLTSPSNTVWPALILTLTETHYL